MKRLADEGVVEQRPTGPKEANGSTLRLTESGKQGVDDACRHAFEEEERPFPPRLAVEALTLIRLSPGC